MKRRIGCVEFVGFFEFIEFIGFVGLVGSIEFGGVKNGYQMPDAR